MLPVILAKTYSSLSAYYDPKGWFFRESFVLLYLWCISHVTSFGHHVLHGYYFSHDISDLFCFLPASCMGARSWRDFFYVESISSHLILHTGLCSLQGFFLIR